MKDNTQLTEQELDDISGGPHIRNFNGRTGVIEKRNNLQEGIANGTFFKSKAGRKGNNGQLADGAVRF